MDELQALQNMARETGLTVHEKYQEDKRRTIKMYFATLDGGSVSPVLNYEKLNNFLLGWWESIKHSNKQL